MSNEHVHHYGQLLFSVAIASISFMANVMIVLLSRTVDGEDGERYPMEDICV